MFGIDKIEKSFLRTRCLCQRAEVQGTSRMRLGIAEAEAAKARADGAATTEAEETAADIELDDRSCLRPFQSRANHSM